MRKLVRVIKIVMLWAAAVCLSLGVLVFALSIVAYFTLIYPPVQERIIRYAEEMMNEYLVGDFKIERFESNLLSYVNVYGFHAVGKSEYRDSLYAGHVSVRYRPLSLLRGRVHISSVKVVNVRGHIVMEPGDHIMIPVMPMKKVDSLYHFIPDPPYREGGRRTRSYDIPKPTDWPVRFVIGPARVDGISAVYRDLSNNMVGEIMNASAVAKFHTLDSFTVQLRVPDARYESPWWNGSVDTLGALGTITWTGLDVHSMMLRGSGTYVTGGGRLSYFEDGPWDLTANFTTVVTPVPILYTAIKGLGKEGVFSGTASYGGKLYEPLWAANVHGRGIKYHGYDVRHMNVEATYRYDDEYGKARARGSSEFGEFDIDASYLMKNLMEGPEFGDYAASALLTGLRAERIADELRVKLPVRIDDANVRLRVVGEGIEMPSAINLSAALGGADIEGGQITIGADIYGNDWEIAGGWGTANRFDGKGRVNLLSGDLRGLLNAELYDPSAVSLTFLNERVTGSIYAAADIEGRFDKLNMSAHVKGAAVEWLGMRADSADAFFTVTDGVPKLGKADAKIRGRIDSVGMRFGVDSLDGYAQAEFSMSGGFDDPFVHAQVSGRQLSYKRYKLDEAYGVLALVGDTVRWHDMRLREKGTHIHSGGKLKLGSAKHGEGLELAASADLYREQVNLSKRHAGRLNVNGSVRGDSLRAKFRVASAPLEILDPWLPEKHRLRGTASMRGEFTGTPANPRARVNFQVTDPQYYGSRAFMFVGDAMLADSSVNAAALLRLTDRSGAVEFTASLPFLPASKWKIDESGARHAFVRAHAKDFDIRTVTGFLEPDFWVYGMASLDAAVNNAGNGWAVDGKLSLPDGHVRYVPKKIDAHNVAFNASVTGTFDDLRASYKLATGAVEMPNIRMEKSSVTGRGVGDTLFIDQSKFSFMGNSHVAITGMMLYGAMDSLMYNRNFYAQYSMRNVPVEMFTFIMPDYSPRKGVFNGSGVIYADGGRPMADGSLYLSRLELTFPDITPVLGPISANVKFDGKDIKLSSAEARWGRGVIRADGGLSWDIDKLYGVNMNVRASDIAFELPEVVNVGVEDANLQITDRNNNINVRGKVVLGPSSFIRDFNVMRFLDQVQTGGGVRREPNPFLRSVRLRVDLDLANNASVNVNLGTVYMDGRVVVAGNLAEPGIVGQVSVTDGFVYYLDRKFKIAEGTLFNPDQTVMNPTLNIIAKSDVMTYSPSSRTETYTITLSLQGTLENPTVRLSAEPALSELDIISILTFGEKMGGLGSDINDRLMNLAAQQVLGLGARRLERMLNLDRVSVSGDVMGAGHGQGATLGVTKRFSSRLNLSYETNMSNLSDRKVTAQYRLLPNFYLEGQSAGDGENALDFIFRYSR